MNLRIDLGPVQVAYAAASARTPVYLLLGFPVSHSASPRMQAAAFRAAGMDGAYVACPVQPAQLPEVVAAMRDRAAAGTVGGANVTVPLKRAVLPLLDDLDPVARLSGAVNTLVAERRPGGQQARLAGYNTDSGGLQAALAEEGVDLRGKRLVITGSGGMARGALAAALFCGARAVWLCARSESQARDLLGEVSSRWPGARPELEACGLEEAPAHLAHADVLVQATSLGMRAEDPPPVDLAAAPAHLFVLDAVYGAAPTALVRLARARGLRASDGRGLLLHQGAAAFALWTGQPAPLAAMRAALDL